MVQLWVYEICLTYHTCCFVQLSMFQQGIVYMFLLPSNPIQQMEQLHLWKGAFGLENVMTFETVNNTGCNTIHIYMIVSLTCHQ